MFTEAKLSAPVEVGIHFIQRFPLITCVSGECPSFVLIGVTSHGDADNQQVFHHARVEFCPYCGMNQPKFNRSHEQAEG